MITTASHLRALIKKQFDLVVFSHLRWDFVFQRPQHLMSRFSKNHRVLFVEEPVATPPHSQKQLRKVSHSLWVLQPTTPSIGSEEYAITVLKAIRKLRMHKPVVWMYSPVFVGFLDKLDYRLVVYDCMDELSAFKGASPKLRNQEIELFNMADIVFTGGKSLYRSKSLHHNKVFCFPSSVDRTHFDSAAKAKLPIPKDIKRLTGPIAGFYGVLDERLDVDLLERVARALPRVNFVMIGPTVKIAESDLPKAANIHYLGIKKYKRLPNYLQRFDVALIPFALNKSTRFISPTKTLEYMAAHKPIVSTPITDVVSDYKGVIKIAHSSSQMVSHILTYLTETAAERKRRLAGELRILTQSSWDKTVNAMEKLILTEIERKRYVPSVDKRSLFGLDWSTKP